MTPAPKPGSVEAIILAVLKADARDTYSPAELARVTRRGTGTIRKALCRLRERVSYAGHPFIVTKNGRYKAFIDRDELDELEAVPLELHSIQGSISVPPNRGRGVRLAARLDGPLKWGAPHDQNGQVIGHGAWMDRRVTVSVSTTGTVQVSLDADERPLSFVEHEMFWEWVRGVVTAYGLVWIHDFAVLDNIEVSQDRKRLALSGGKGRRIMLREWRNGWKQVYQKSPFRLRVEQRLTKDRDEVCTIAEAMTWGPPRLEREQEIDWSAFRPAGKWAGDSPSAPEVS